MSSTDTLISRNERFAEGFSSGALPILPKLRAVVLTCGDARVDPAHVLGLDLGDAVVIRNNGGRVTPSVIDEVSALAFLVAQMDGGEPGPFELTIMHHTRCGAERFADPGVQRAMKDRLGIDVSAVAITDHEVSVRDDIARVVGDPRVPAHVVVSGLIYDTETGAVRVVAEPTSLAEYRGEAR